MAADPQELIGRAEAGDRRALARIISLVEDDRDGARELLAALYPRGGRAAVTGITGTPGAGKSTLVDRLLTVVRRDDVACAVVAVDPSSPFSGGAILGDRIRMQGHAGDPGVYVRSMANRGHLGGLAAATPRVVAVLDGIGFPEILVETVGVGQAEVAIAGTADTTVVVVTPGWGDGVQAAKAGLLEVADVFVVNKADLPGAEAAVAELTRMLDLGPAGPWRPPIVPTVATTGAGATELWDAVARHRRFLTTTGAGEERRRRRALAALEEAVGAALRHRAAAHHHATDGVLAAVLARRLDPWTAAERILTAEEAP